MAPVIARSWPGLSWIREPAPAAALVFRASSASPPRPYLIAVVCARRHCSVALAAVLSLNSCCPQTLSSSSSHHPHFVSAHALVGYDTPKHLTPHPEIIRRGLRSLAPTRTHRSEDPPQIHSCSDGEIKTTHPHPALHPSLRSPSLDIFSDSVNSVHHLHPAQPHTAMPFKSRLRAAISRSPTSSTTSTASSSTSDLSSSPLATSPQLTTIPSTPSVGLTKAATTLTLASTTSSSKTLKKSESSSRLRTLLTRSRSSNFLSKAAKSSAAKTEQEMISEWHAYNGPKSRFRKHVDPLHRAQLEAWEWEFGRTGSVATVGGLSPCASRAGSLDLRRVEANEERGE